MNKRTAEWYENKAKELRAKEKQKKEKEYAQLGKKFEEVFKISDYETMLKLVEQFNFMKGEIERLKEQIQVLHNQRNSQPH